MSITATKPHLKKTPATPTVRHGSHAHFNLTGKGIVHYYVQGESLKSVHSDLNSANVIKVLEHGLPATELTDLQASLAVPVERLAPMLGISKATFHRSKETGQKLKPYVSDRVIRFAKLLGKAVKVLGDLEAAKQWLNSPQ